MTDSVVVEGYARLRDGKKVVRLDRFPTRTRSKCLGSLFCCLFNFFSAFFPSLCPPPLQWRTRWLVLRKPSPVAGNGRAPRCCARAVPPMNPLVRPAGGFGSLQTRRSGRQRAGVAVSLELFNFEFHGLSASVHGLETDPRSSPSSRLLC